jgi:hypothetical protein
MDDMLHHIQATADSLGLKSAATEVSHLYQMDLSHLYQMDLSHLYQMDLSYLSEGLEAITLILYVPLFHEDVVLKQ